METRSHTKHKREILHQQLVYDVDIDFDGASTAWNYNKKRVGNGEYKYICCKKKTKSGRKCGNMVLATSNYCKTHSRNSSCEMEYLS